MPKNNFFYIKGLKPPHSAYPRPVFASKAIAEKELSHMIDIYGRYARQYKTVEDCKKFAMIKRCKVVELVEKK